MLYFKNKELTDTHRVALNTVLNWIKAAEQGKLDLKLVTKGERSYIANTAQNQQIIERLVAERKKYRNTRSAREVTPSAQFYELYNEQQIYDIISNLEIHHEISRKYNYFDGGATMWDKYVNRLASEGGSNTVVSPLDLLGSNRAYLDTLLKPFERVNLVDIGSGNALPAKPTLENLLEQGILSRYIAIDISPTMLKIAEENIKKWFGNKVKFEGHLLDFENDRFKYILDNDTEALNIPTINIFFLWGGTIDNFRNPSTGLQSVQSNMGRHDILIHDHKLDTPTSRRLIYANDQLGPSELPSNHRLMFDLTNIDPSFYTVEMGFEPVRKMRYIQARLQVSLRLKFSLSSGERFVDFEKGDAILLYRYWHQDVIGVMNQFMTNGLYPLHFSQTEDREYLLTISRVDPDLLP